MKVLESTFHDFQREDDLLKKRVLNPFSIVLYFISSIFLFLFINSLTGTRNIAFALCISALVIPIQIERSKRSKFADELSQAWPEVIDQLVSGIQSGLSLSESVVALSLRGPRVSRKVFSTVAELHIRGMSFNDSMLEFKNICKSMEADLIAESLMVARNLGGRDVGIVLRLLGEYFRENLALREEIKAKHGWIKNSAILASLAPWILLIILSSQESTRTTYASVSGLLVLLCGAGLTLTAFLWMHIVGRIPVVPRLFAIKELNSRMNLQL